MDKTMSLKEVKEIEDVEYILNIGVPRVYLEESAPIPFTGGMHFLIITDTKGEPLYFYECRGYHRRKLIDVIDGKYVYVNTLSPYMEGVFQSRQSVSNELESHPLIKGAYRRDLLSGLERGE